MSTQTQTVGERLRARLGVKSQVVERPVLLALRKKIKGEAQGQQVVLGEIRKRFKAKGQVEGPVVKRLRERFGKQVVPTPGAIIEVPPTPEVKKVPPILLYSTTGTQAGPATPQAAVVPIRTY